MDSRIRAGTDHYDATIRPCGRFLQHAGLSDDFPHPSALQQACVAKLETTIAKIGNGGVASLNRPITRYETFQIGDRYHGLSLALRANMAGLAYLSQPSLSVCYSTASSQA